MTVLHALAVANGAAARRIARQLDRRDDIRCRIETDPEAAFDRLTAGAVDCVLVEHDPPTTDGPALAATARDRGATAVVLDPDPDPDGATAARAFEAGAADYAPADPTPWRCRRLAERLRAEDERRRRRRAVRSLAGGFRDLMRGRSVDRICELTVESAERAVDLTAAGVHLVDRDGALSAAATTGPATDRERPPSPPDALVREAYESGEIRRIGGGDGDGGRAAERNPAPARGVVAPLGRHGALAVAWRPRECEAAAEELVRLLAANATAALDRACREERLRRLHEATRDLMAAPSEGEVARVATEAAREVLGLELNGVLRDDGDGTLVAVALTPEARALLGEDTELSAGDSVAWEAYAGGEALVFDDVRRADRAHNERTPIRGEFIVPMDGYGVFIAGSTDEGAFDPTDVALAKVLAANVEAALDRAEREETLRAREAELARQNDRLDEFASVVSHDIRNPLNVAEGRLGLARERVADGVAAEHFEAVERAHERMAALVDDLLALARHGRTVGDPEPVALADLAREAAESAGVEVEARVAPGAAPGTVRADPSRLRELFENLIANAAEHAGPDPTVTVGALGEEQEAEAGFYVADDGPGLPPDARRRVFERGYTTAEGGTGFGLTVVETIARAHGWTVDATESATGGARFEFRVDG